MERQKGAGGLGGGMTAEAHAATMAAQVAEAQRAAGVETFELPDHAGNLHSYTVVLHRVDDGLDVVGALISIGGEPLGGILQGSIGEVIAGGLFDGGDGGDLAAALAKVDWSAVGQHLASAVRQVKLSRFAAEILKYAHRDGQALRDAAARDAAYRGNYAELYRALFAVIRANRFLPF